MNWNIVSNWADIMGILGFLLTIVTLIVTMRIKKSVLVMTDTNQYYRKRQESLGKLKECLSDINRLTDIKDAIPIMNRIDHEIQLVIRYEIWKTSDNNSMNAFLDYNSRKTNEVISMLAKKNEAESAVTIIPEDIMHFISEYHRRLTVVYEIVNRDSAVISGH